MIGEMNKINATVALFVTPRVISTLYQVRKARAEAQAEAAAAAYSFFHLSSFFII